MGDISVFSPGQRERIREELVAAAKGDSQISGAAHLGSAALGLQDRWSDIDIALCLAHEEDSDQVVADWTARLYRDHGAVTNFDLRRGSILYRVFLLENTLQIDLSFWPSLEFRALGPKFSLIFGSAKETINTPAPDSKNLIGMAWLHALHVRSSIARSRLLQAEYMLSGMRDNVLALICKRCGTDSVQGRGLDDLPEHEKARAAECLASSLDPSELRRVFQVTLEALLEEIRWVDPNQAATLQQPLKRIVSSLFVT